MCLSQIVLTHALRQSHRWLTLDVGQKLEEVLQMALEFSQSLLLVESIYKANGWMIPVGAEHSDESIVYEGLLGLLNACETSAEVACLESMYCRFLWRSNEAMTKMVKAAAVAAVQNSQKRGEILIVPALIRRESNTVKSSSFVAYSLRQVDWRHLTDRSIRAVDSPDSCHVMRGGEQNTILLVDDFIGSGGTFEKVLVTLADSSVKLGNRLEIIAVCAVAHRDGIARMAAHGIEVYSYMCIDKYYNWLSRADSLARKAVVEAFSKRIGVGKRVVHGHKDTSALVAFDVVPNNTFGLFWSPPHGKPTRPFRRPV